MNNFLELAKARYSCRSFSDKPVEKEKLDKILEAGRLAPTAKNVQPQRILVLTEKEEIAKLKHCTPCGWNAPVQIIVCYDVNESYKRRDNGLDLGIIDASIVTTHMMLEASDIGLGSTWIELIDGEKIRKNFDIPENLAVFALLVLGYPSEDAKPSHLHYSRKDLNETVFFNKF